MLTAVFKDYLIFDDIYEFLEKFYKQKASKLFIKNHAAQQNTNATQKYGFKPSDVHENIINRPNYVLFSEHHKKILYNNLRLKYLMKYEKRV
jgi:hypothetical protein